MELGVAYSYFLLYAALNLAVNTQPIDHPVLLIEMSNVGCSGITYVNKYKRVWILFTTCNR